MSSQDPQRTHPSSKSPSSGNEPEVQHWVDFLQLSDKDAERIRSLRPLFAEGMSEFIEAFYKHLFAFPETSRFLQDPEIVEPLKRTQQRHFESMLDAQWDESFGSGRRKVGRTHAEVGIEPRFFLGGYTQYLQYFFRSFAKERGIAEEDVDHLLSLVKVIILDLGLSLDAYFDQLTHQMREALDLFWRTNNELRRFAQLTSHDLKTPLATVANLCDEAMDEFKESMPEEARALIKSATSRIYRMSTMIDELLSVATSTFDGIEPQRVDTESVMQEAIDRVRPQMGKKGISLHIERPLPDVWGDKVRLREVFSNLLSNAVKFIDTEPGRIDIFGEVRDTRTVIGIRDNGPGIPKEELDRVFVPFRRLPAHRSLPGSGLGLYFTKNIVEEHHGRIWAESTPNEDTTFYVELPSVPANS